MPKHSDCNISDAVNYVYDKYNNRDTYVFCIVRTKGIYYGSQEKSKSILDDINNNNLPIQISTIYNENTSSKYGYARNMVAKTGGGTWYSYEDSSSFMLSRIYGKVPQLKGYKAIIGTGYKTVLLNRPISLQYEWFKGGHLDERTDADDLDKDGLYDYQEILFRCSDEPLGEWLINIDDPNNIQLYTFKEIKSKVGEELFYIENGLKRYRNSTGDYTKSVDSLNSARILPIKSDPMEKDTDKDSVDRKPLIKFKHFSECVYISTYNMHSVDKHYFDKENNPKINRDKQLIFCCENCDEEFLSPEYQDKDILNESEYALVQMILQVINCIFDKEEKTDIDENHIESLYLIIDRIRSSKSANGVNFYDFSSDYENGIKYTSPLNYKYNNVNNKTHTITLDIRQTTQVELYESMQLKLFASYGLDYALGLAFSWKYTAVKVIVDIVNKDISTTVSDIVDANIDELSNKLINAIANDDNAGEYLCIGNILLGYNYLQSANNINKQFDSNMYYNYIYSGVICITDSAQEQEVYYINLCFDYKDNVNQACIDVKDFEIFCNNQDNYNEFTLNNGTTQDILYSHPDSNTQKYKLL